MPPKDKDKMAEEHNTVMVTLYGPNGDSGMYKTLEENCKKTAQIESENQKIKQVMWGASPGDGGMVSDVKDIKSTVDDMKRMFKWVLWIICAGIPTYIAIKSKL